LWRYPKQYNLADEIAEMRFHMVTPNVVIRPQTGP
jgi:hypothetical protein